MIIVVPFVVLDILEKLSILGCILSLDDYISACIDPLVGTRRGNFRLVWHWCRFGARVVAFLSDSRCTLLLGRCCCSPRATTMKHLWTQTFPW